MKYYPRCKVDKSLESFNKCKRPASEFHYGLHVDHNHETGKVRGMLCVRCNRAIGLVKDSFDVAYNLAKYLHEDS